jgi:HK97 family phage major capsid protein
MDEKQIQLIVDQVTQKTADKVKALSEAEQENRKKEFDGLKNDVMDSLKKELGPESDHVKAMQQQLDDISTKMKKGENREEEKSTALQIGEMMKTDEYKNFAEGRSGGRFVKEIPLDRKAAGTMLNSGQSGVFPRPTWVPGVQKDEDLPVFVSSLLNIGTTTSNTVYYTERTARTDGAASRAEGAAMGQSDMTYTQRSTSVVDIGSFITISRQMLTDTEWMNNELNTELRGLVLRELDNELLLGAGSGTDLNGIINRSTAFAAGNFAASVPNAGYFDVLRVAINQARRNNYMPTHVLVHSDDYTMMELNKTSDGQYDYPPFYAASGLQVSGVKIVANNLITAGTYVVCTMPRARLYMRENLMVEAWYEHSDNATKGLVTFTATVRAAFYIAAEHANGFITGTFAAGIAAINKA